MALPSNISTGLVTGQFLAAVIDGVDPDMEPDARPVQGFVTFTASVPYLPDPTATPNPATVLHTPLVAVLDADGYLCTPEEGSLVPAYRGVRMIATDDPDVSVSGWTWNATYKFTAVNGAALSIPTHSFAVPSDATVDLTTVVRVPSSSGIGTEQAEALAASAQAAAVAAAQDAATAAQAASDAAGAAQVTDANISALVADPGTDTGAAVVSLVNDASATKLDANDAAATYQPISTLGAAVAAQVNTNGTSTNTNVKTLAGTVIDAKIGAPLGAAPLDAGARVPEANLPAGLAASALGTTFAGLTEVNTPTARFDQFPIPLTDTTPINSSVTNTSVVRVVGGGVYATFWGADMNPYVAMMADGDSTWQVVNLGALPGNPLNAPAPADEHNALAIVVDGSGFIHISGNHHRVPLNYIRSAVAWSITDGWESPGMIGADELEVTYPQFIKTNTGDLLFFYRAGTSSDGDLMLNKYSTATKTWTRVGMVLKGHDWLTSTDDVSAYPGKFVYDVTPGRVHVWWEWRDTTSVDSNFDLCYIHSTDNGATWQNAANTTISLPITPAETAVKIFAGGSGHTVGGACVDSSGNSYAAVRMADGENRLYKRSGSSVTYTVMGTGMGHTSIVYTPDGKIYALYADTNVPYIKQVSPTVGTPVRMFPWTLPNWTASMYTPDPGSYTLRILIAPVRKKAGANYGGILTFDATATNIDNMAAGKTVVPKPRAITPITDPVRHTPGSYPMVPGFYYGPSGPRANTPSNIANGTFRGQIVTAARAGKIVECAVNVVTAGAAGAKIRFVIYRLDGRVVAQSADVDVTITGTRSATLSANIGKNEQLIVGTIQHSSTGASAVFSGTTSNHDSRIALANATSYFTAVRGGFQITGLAVPAVDQSVNFLNPAAGAAVASADNTPIVVIKAGDMPADWLSGSE